MTPADRVALAARLRAEAAWLNRMQERRDGSTLSVGRTDPKADDLLAAAADLERPRPRVEWTTPTGDTVEAHLRGVGMIWRGSVTSAPAHAERWRAAGLDVTEVPRG